jgi:hypothetical protein
VDDKHSSEDRNEFAVRKLAFPFSVGNIRAMRSLSPNKAWGVPDGLSANRKLSRNGLRGSERTGSAWIVGNPDIECQLSALELMNAATIALRKHCRNYGPIMVQ